MRTMFRSLAFVMLVLFSGSALHGLFDSDEEKLTKKIKAIEEDFRDIMYDFLKIPDDNLAKFARDKHDMRREGYKKNMQGLESQVALVLGSGEVGGDGKKTDSFVVAFTKRLKAAGEAERHYQRRLLSECYRRNLKKPKLKDNGFTYKDITYIVKYDDQQYGKGWHLQDTSRRKVTSLNDPIFQAWLDQELIEHSLPADAPRSGDDEPASVSSAIRNELPPLTLIRTGADKPKVKLNVVRNVALLLSFRQRAKTPLRKKRTARLSVLTTTSIKKVLEKLAELIEDNSGEFDKEQSKRVSDLYKKVDEFRDRLETFYAQAEQFLVETMCIPKATIEKEDTSNRSKSLTGKLLICKSILAKMKPSKKEFTIKGGTKKGKKTSPYLEEKQQREFFIKGSRSQSKQGRSPINQALPKKFFLGFKIKNLQKRLETRAKAERSALKKLKSYKKDLFDEDRFNKLSPANKKKAYPLYRHLMTQHAEYEVATLATGMETFAWRTKFLDALKAAGEKFDDVHKVLKDEKVWIYIKNKMQPVDDIHKKIFQLKMKDSHNLSLLVAKKDFFGTDKVAVLRKTGYEIYRKLNDHDEVRNQLVKKIETIATSFASNIEQKLLVAISGHVKKQTYLAWANEYLVMARFMFALKAFILGLRGTATGKMVDQPALITFEKTYFSEYGIATGTLLIGGTHAASADQREAVSVFGRERNKGARATNLQTHSRFSGDYLDSRHSYRGDSRLDNAAYRHDDDQSHKDLSRARGRFDAAQHRGYDAKKDRLNFAHSDDIRLQDDHDDYDDEYAKGFDSYGNQKVGSLWGDRETRRGRQDKRDAERTKNIEQGERHVLNATRAKVGASRWTKHTRERVAGHKAADTKWNRNTGRRHLEEWDIDNTPLPEGQKAAAKQRYAEHRAATRIQAVARGRAGRRQAQEKRQEERSVRRIQTAYRGRLSRRGREQAHDEIAGDNERQSTDGWAQGRAAAYNGIHDRHERRTNNARRIQAVARGKMGRNRARLIKAQNQADDDYRSLRGMTRRSELPTEWTDEQQDAYEDRSNEGENPLIEQHAVQIIRTTGPTASGRSSRRPGSPAAPPPRAPARRRTTEYLSPGDTSMQEPTHRRRGSDSSMGSTASGASSTDYDSDATSSLRRRHSFSSTTGTTRQRQKLNRSLSSKRLQVHPAKREGRSRATNELFSGSQGSRVHSDMSPHAQDTYNATWRGIDDGKAHYKESPHKMNLVDWKEREDITSSTSYDNGFMQGYKSAQRKDSRHSRGRSRERGQSSRHRSKPISLPRRPAGPPPGIRNFGPPPGPPPANQRSMEQIRRDARPPAGPPPASARRGPPASYEVLAKSLAQQKIKESKTTAQFAETDLYFVNGRDIRTTPRGGKAPQALIDAYLKETQKLHHNLVIARRAQRARDGG